MKIISARDESVDIAKGIGILFVIGGHCEFNPVGFPADSFHMPLFYFISGFFIFKYILNEKVSTYNFIKNKFISLLMPYAIYNIFFGLLSYFLQYINIYFNRGAFFEVLSFKNLFVEPFIEGWQFPISGSLWFVVSLFCVMLAIAIIRPVIYFIYNKRIYCFLFIIILIVIFYLCVFSPNGYAHRYLGAFTRTIIGSVYCILGFIYYQYKNKINNLVLFIASVIIYSYISVKYGNCVYNIHHSFFGEGMVRKMAFPVQMSGILIIISISNFLVANNGQFKKFLMFFGKNSYHIMAWHLTGFLILNMILIIVFNHSLNFTIIKGVFWRMPHINWLYFIFSAYFCYLLLKHVTILNHLFLLKGNAKTKNV